MSANRVARVVWLSVICLTAAACTTGAPKPVKVEGGVAAAAALNPDASGRPSPVVVRVFQLRADAKFNNADFFSLYDNEQATLGADLITRDELQVQPGETLSFAPEISPDCRFLGVMAAFRDYENAKWRDIAEVPEEGLMGKFKKDSLQIELDSLAVSISMGR